MTGVAMRTSALALLSAALLLPAAAGVRAADGTGRYGQPLPATGDVVPVAVAAADPARYAGSPRRFSGRITEVCQKEGCWLMLEDDGHAARVMMRDHAFTVPKTASGAAEVYGVLSVKQLSEAAAKHLAEDAGDGAPVPAQELRIQADGVRIDG